LAERRAWVRRARGPIVVLLLVLGAANVYLCGHQKQSRGETRALLAYFGKSWPALHVEVRSIQAGLVSLVDDTAPSAQGAVARLNDNIVPSLERVIEAARLIAPEEEAARVMHRDYLTALEVTRKDALRARAIFAEPHGGLHGKRLRVAGILEELNQRYEAWSAQARAVCAAHGISLTPPADAGPATK
jgi:hypothetical protein